MTNHSLKIKVSGALLGALTVAFLTLGGSGTTVASASPQSNGQSVNGMRVNGMRVNGASVDGTAVRPAFDGIILPAAK